jgi:C3HC zinc finger-like
MSDSIPTRILAVTIREGVVQAAVKRKRQDCVRIPEDLFDSDRDTSTEQAAVDAASSISTLLSAMVSLPPSSKTSAVPQVTTTMTTTSLQKEYRRRLQSYTTISYFAKPIHLSPILCAITGWELKPNKVKTQNPISTKHRIHSGLLTLPLHNDSSLIETTSRLLCTTCRAIITMYIPNSLSDVSKQDLVLQYHQQLYAAHAMQCPHRASAEYLLNTTLVQSTGTCTDQSDNKHHTTSPSALVPSSPSKPPTSQQPKLKLVVPTILARAICSPCENSLSSLELVEQTTPWRMCIQKFQRMYPYILERTHQPIRIPDFIRYYKESDNDTTGTTTFDADTNSHVVTPSSSTCVLRRLVHMFQSRTSDDGHVDDDDDDDDGDPQQQQRQHTALQSISTPMQLQAAETTMALIITGWDLNCDTTNAGTHLNNAEGHTSSIVKSVPHRYIKCIFCLSQQYLTDTSVPSVAAAAVPTNQRPRTTIPQSQWDEPYIAHRYYCPWVCGFPMTSSVVNDITNTNPVSQSLKCATMSEPSWQIVINRLLTEPQPQHMKNDLETIDTIIHNVLHIQEQLRTSISPLRYNHKSLIQVPVVKKL